MRVLVVDNGGQWTHREWRVLRDLGVETEIVSNRAPLESIDADGLVLSGGSPRVGLDGEAMGLCGEYLDRLDLPILGICAGHQFMAIHLGGKAGPSTTPEFGKTLISVVDEDDLFSDLSYSSSSSSSKTQITKRSQYLARSPNPEPCLLVAP